MTRILSTLAITALASSAVIASDAPAVLDNPIGVQYMATMPASGDGGVYAQFAVMSGPAGNGVAFSININGKVFDDSKFMYHIHNAAIPSNGNCAAALAHLDPYNVGENTPCDPAKPAACQVGDLSGKYGTIPHLPGFTANYTDKFLSLNPGSPAFMGDKSIVIHYPNKDRIACANFKLVQKNGNLASSTMPASSTTMVMVTTSSSTMVMAATSTSMAAGLTTIAVGTSTSSVVVATNPAGGIIGITPTGSMSGMTLTTISSSGTAKATAMVSSGADAMAGKVAKKEGAVLGPMLLAFAAAVL